MTNPSQADPFATFDGEEAFILGVSSPSLGIWDQQQGNEGITTNDQTPNDQHHPDHLERQSFR
jgi:hypothetical protein